MGFEYATRRPFDAARATPDDMQRARAESPCDLTEDVAEANDLLDRIAAQAVDGALRQLTPPPPQPPALLRYDTPDPRDASPAALVLINPDMPPPHRCRCRLIRCRRRPAPRFAQAETLDAPANFQPACAPARYGSWPTRGLPQSSQQRRHAPVERTTVIGSHPHRHRGASRPPWTAATSPAKRVVGDPVIVSADIIADGHEVLAAALLWRPADDPVWQRVPMRLVNNDRWAASFIPSRIGPHHYTVEAWWDVWGTFRHDLHAKHAANVPVTLELEEGRRMLEAAAQRAQASRKSRRLSPPKNRHGSRSQRRSAPKRPRIRR